MKKRLTKRLTFEQHTELGAKLTTARQDLVEAWCLLANTYGERHKYRVTQKVTKVNEALDTLRCWLDELVFEEYPEKTTGDLARVYYGRGEYIKADADDDAKLDTIDEHMCSCDEIGLI